MPDVDRGRDAGDERSSSGAEPSATETGDRARELASSAWRKDLARYGGLGMQLAAILGAFAYLGFRADRWLATSPLFLLLGVGLGFVGGFLALRARIPPVTGRRRTGRPPSKTES